MSLQANDLVCRSVGGEQTLRGQRGVRGGMSCCEQKEEQRRLANDEMGSTAAPRMFAFSQLNAPNMHTRTPTPGNPVETTTDCFVVEYDMFNGVSAR